MDAIDKAITAALERQRAGGVTFPSGQMHATKRKGTVAQSERPKVVDPWSPEAILRAANEDDDLYDPYSDYMDALARSSHEELEEDPWR